MSGRPTSWRYRLRKEGSGGMLAVPPEVYTQIPEGTLFSLTITETGLLYEPIQTSASTVSVPWVSASTSRVVPAEGKSK